MKKVGTIVFGLLMIVAGAMHFIMPHMYDPFMSDFLPKLAVNYVTGVVEMLVGLAMFFPASRSRASLLILVMMIAFLPLHITDIFRENPAIGSHMAAYIRLPIQFLLVFLAYKLWQSLSRT
ncbi:MAG: hypothetical protein GC178_02215 [Flavobacteriales bacterium]|nr:hypothetical protein [Flavobacteriales bacterium]